MTMLTASSLGFSIISLWIVSPLRASRCGHVGLVSPGNPFQYSCLKNPMDTGAWQATVHGIAESDMTE